MQFHQFVETVFSFRHGEEGSQFFLVGDDGGFVLRQGVLIAGRKDHPADDSFRGEFAVKFFGVGSACRFCLFHKLHGDGNPVAHFVVRSEVVGFDCAAGRQTGNADHIAGGFVQNHKFRNVCLADGNHGAFQHVNAAYGFGFQFADAQELTGYVHFYRFTNQFVFHEQFQFQRQLMVGVRGGDQVFLRGMLPFCAFRSVRINGLVAHRFQRQVAGRNQSLVHFYLRIRNGGRNGNVHHSGISAVGNDYLRVRHRQRFRFIHGIVGHDLFRSVRFRCFHNHTGGVEFFARGIYDFRRLCRNFYCGYIRLATGGKSEYQREQQSKRKQCCYSLFHTGPPCFGAYSSGSDSPIRYTPRISLPYYGKKSIASFFGVARGCVKIDEKTNRKPGDAETDRKKGTRQFLASFLFRLVFRDWRSGRSVVPFRLLFRLPAGGFACGWFFS